MQGYTTIAVVLGMVAGWITNDQSILSVMIGGIMTGSLSYAIGKGIS